MPVITIASTKGGVGKSTICLNLAVELSKAGRSVSLFDADPQQSLFKWNRVRKLMIENGETVFPIPLTKIAETGIDGFLVDVQSKSESGGFILIDSAGADDQTTRAALLRSDAILTLCSTAPMDLWEIESALETVRELEQAQQRRIKFGLLFNRVSPNSHSKAVDAALLFIEQSGLTLDHIFQTSLKERVIYKNAAGEGRAIGEYKPLDSIAALEFNQFVSEFLSFTLI